MRSLPRLPALGFWLVAATLVGAGCAPAEPGALIVTKAWVRPSQSVDQPSAGYLTITNDTGQHQRLVGVTTPVADIVEMHRTQTDSAGMTEMAQVDEINIPPGGTVTLEPGGFHLMLMGLHSPLSGAVEVVQLTLHFDPAGLVDVDADVRASSP